MTKDYVNIESALLVGEKVVCDHTKPVIKTHEDLGIWWKLIYWATFIVTFGSVKMTDFAFVLGSSMYMREPKTARPELIIHESVHMRQRERHGKLWWYIMYLFTLPTCFTMRSRYEGDAYAVSSIIEALHRVWRKEGRPINMFKYDDYYGQVRRTQRALVDYYVDHFFRAWPYFFMACRKESVRKRLMLITDEALLILFNVSVDKTDLTEKEQLQVNEFISETNVVEAARALFIRHTT